MFSSSPPEVEALELETVEALELENMDPTRDFRYPKSHFPGAKDKLNVWTGRA